MACTAASNLSPPNSTSQPSCAINWLTLGRHMGLSAQQVQILQLIVDQDRTAPRLARSLHVKPSCITEQLDRMRKKLNVHSSLRKISIID